MKGNEKMSLTSKENLAKEILKIYDWHELRNGWCITNLKELENHIEKYPFGWIYELSQLAQG